MSDNQLMAIRFPRLKKFRLPADILANRDWYEKSWAGVLFPLHIVGYGCVYLINKRVEDAFRFSVTFVKNDKMSWFWDNRDLTRIRTRVLEWARKNPRKIQQYLRQWRTDWKNFKQVVRQLEKINFALVSDAELYRLYLQLRDVYVMANSLPYLADSFLNAGESDWLAEIIKKELTGKVREGGMNEAIARLTAPVADSFSNREAIDLLELAVKFQGRREINRAFLAGDAADAWNILCRDADSYQQLKNHAVRYYWVENSYYPSEPLDERYFFDKIVKIIREGGAAARLRSERDRIKNNKAVKRRLFRRLGVSAELRKIIRLAEQFTAWQDTRKSGVFMTNHFLFLILREMGRRVGLKPFEVYYATDHELKDIFLKKKFNRRKLRARRRRGCAFAHTPNGDYLFEGAEYAQLDKSVFFGSAANVKEIRGVPASPGVVRGRARVINNFAGFGKFQDGEVLVTNNTTPDFVPLMKRAAAVVTEQGGITTHAAIVARELGIPCVIGTKIATRVFKDGDTVEVDADKGIIKKLK